jgi:hypothetical protein
VGRRTAGYLLRQLRFDSSDRQHLDGGDPTVTVQPASNYTPPSRYDPRPRPGGGPEAVGYLRFDSSPSRLNVPEDSRDEADAAGYAPSAAL